MKVEFCASDTNAFYGYINMHLLMLISINGSKLKMTIEKTSQYIIILQPFLAYQSVDHTILH